MRSQSIWIILDLPKQQRQNQERDFAHWIIEKICQEQIGIIAGAMTMDKFQRVQYRACRTTTVER